MYATLRTPSVMCMQVVVGWQNHFKGFTMNQKSLSNSAQPGDSALVDSAATSVRQSVASTAKTSSPCDNTMPKIPAERMSKGFLQKSMVESF